MRTALLLLVVAAQAAAQTPPPSPHIVSTPPAVVRGIADQPLKITGSEIELLTVASYDGEVSWQVVSQSGESPVKVVPLKAGTIVVGVRAGTSEPAEYTVPGQTALVYARGHGTVTVLAFGAKLVDGKPVPFRLAQQLVEANLAPNPPPEPGPGPDPSPSPAGKAVWAIVIESKVNRTVEQARVLSDTLGWKSLGIRWKMYDVSQPYAQTAAAKKAVDKAGGLPALLLLNAEGDLLRSVPLPATMADLKKEVAK